MFIWCPGSTLTVFGPLQSWISNCYLELLCIYLNIIHCIPQNDMTLINYHPIWQYYIYTIVWFLRAPRWYIGPTAMPRAAVTPIAPERSEGAIGCDSRPRHCRRDDIPAWRPNKITLLSLLPLDLMMYHRFVSFIRAVQSREGRWFNPRYCL